MPKCPSFQMESYNRQQTLHCEIIIFHTIFIQVNTSSSFIQNNEIFKTKYNPMFP